jgi:thioredoxin 1
MSAICDQSTTLKITVQNVKQRRFELKRVALLFCLAFIMTGFGFSHSAGQSSSIPEVPAKDMVTMVDIRAKECIPCKMMAPIMESLEKEYKGRAAIIFIDVWKNREQGQRFGIRSIPTQIFYDKGGKEVYRHEGFLSRDFIVAQLEELGVKAGKSNESKNSDR